MKRLGKITKTIYDDYAHHPECCTCITDEQANDKEFIEQHHLKDLQDCMTCFGCPAALSYRV